ncbi:unnamed protein product [Nippostrongylus brasiliensis]|uniref:Transposase n=1 Tax=Nippostrongylus brasiliensis TaxID=27835 RepID=A0A0N4YID4_NIPBR|nr:unnamed protein product [Nippostrongylus brasiliensis]
MSSDVQQSQRIRYNGVTRKQKEILIKLALVDGKKTREAAMIAGINENTARGLIRAYKREGEIVERNRGGCNAQKITPEVMEFIEETVEQNPQYTLEQVRRSLKDEKNVDLSVSSVFNALGKLRITLKKAHRVGFDLKTVEFDLKSVDIDSKNVVIG